MTIAKRLQNLRQEHKWSARTLGSLAMISPATIYAHEKGQSSPSWEFLQWYARSYGITMTELTEGVE